MRALRVAALIAAVAGGVGAAGLVLYACIRIGSPRVLMGLFALWVLTPFVALLVAYVRSRRWPVLTQTVLCWLILVVAVVSFGLYAPVALGEQKPKAPVFVVVPPASWLLIAIVLTAAALISAKRSPRSLK